MKPLHRTSAAWLVAILALLGYEGYALLNGAPGDTLSEAVWTYGQHPLIALAVGVLLGHFYWQRRPKRSDLRLVIGALKCLHRPDADTLRTLAGDDTSEDRYWLGWTDALDEVLSFLTPEDER